MTEEKRDHHYHPEHPPPPAYGTFQGVANHPPPTAIGLPQPVPPPGISGVPPPQSQYYAHGYQAVPGYAVAEGRPLRERRLPCCGIGIGWFLSVAIPYLLIETKNLVESFRFCYKIEIYLINCAKEIQKKRVVRVVISGSFSLMLFWFIIGFFLAAIPWYVGVLLLLCSRIDPREKPGYVACTIAAVLATIAVIFGLTRIDAD
ncbi:UNVERIFIED_CONTAM: 60S ribosomal protein L18a-like protein [Sesamum calycinum]|uniref:60S ribosomal protein L18a-like protein n=1 Tax=Sesamum calycinum TaxID=2727403 RepID=A0AAW2Q4D5_9LAMI